MSGKGTASLSFLRIYVFTATLVLSLMAALLLVVAGVSDGPHIRMSRLAMPLFASQDVQLASATDGQPGGACALEAAETAKLKALVPDAEVTVLNSVAYMAIFNTLPPATVYPPPLRLVAFTSPRHTTALLLGFGGDGCQMMVATVRMPDHEAILRRLGTEI